VATPREGVATATLALLLKESQQTQSIGNGKQLCDLEIEILTVFQIKTLHLAPRMV
jgi:hypothetical protein